MATQTNEKAIVITGGPGMGKTAMITSLERLGYSCIDESGRHIIQEQLKSGGNNLPWDNQQGFAMKMFRMAIADYHRSLNNKGFTFFDRGIPDVVGYLILCQLSIPDEVWSAARTYSYRQPVFIAPPWEEIYVNDNERKQSFGEAKATYEVMRSVYADLGYSLVEIPKISIEKRVSYILEYLRKPISVPS